MPEVTFVFNVNGTDKNPYEQYGLRQNPFPQHGRREWNRADMMMQSLGGEPIKSADDIRARLKGDSEFIERIIKEFYKPGKMVHVKLKIHWP